ncbi:MAG: hypothetical protein ACON5B_02820 [Myxococcota bacterium]
MSNQRNQMRLQQMQQMQQMQSAAAPIRPAGGTHQSTGARDTLVELVMDHLGRVNEAQLAEVAACSPGAIAQHKRALADSHDTSASIPDPSRWHDVALLYQRALEALMRGDVERGASLVRAAMAEEQHILSTTSRVVDLGDVRKGRPMPATLMTGACPSCPRPAGFEVIDTILKRDRIIDELAVKRVVRPPERDAELEEDTNDDEDST